MRLLDYRAAVRESVSTTAELATYLRERGYDPGEALGEPAEPAVLPLRVPRYYLDLIDFADPADPLRRQVLPSAAEREVDPAELADPIGDGAHSPTPGVVHRYPDRALLLLTAACAVHCRFCFRREFIGQPARALGPAALEAAYAYLAATPAIWEVILSGGDPLVLAPRRLKDIVEALAAIEHVKVIRVHTRVPVATPERVTREVVRALKASGKATYVVLHANHPRELTPAARAACAQFIDAGIPMLSQSVLLRGVNDDAATLGALMRALVESRIRPYYLHQGDLARGTEHLRTSIAEGQELMRALRGRYSGLCQPTFVLDIPGGHGKVPVGPIYFAPGEKGSSSGLVLDPAGRRHPYPPTRP